jgi:hypothetical protein
VGIMADFAQILRTLQSPDTTNAHCCAMRLQRRLSTVFTAAGHLALRPHSPARASQKPGPLCEMLATGKIKLSGKEFKNDRIYTVE